MKRMTTFILWMLSSMCNECSGTSFVVCVFISVHAFGDEVVLQGNLRNGGKRIIRRSRGMRTEKTGLNKIDALHPMPAAPLLLMEIFLMLRRRETGSICPPGSICPRHSSFPGSVWILDSGMRKDQEVSSALSLEPC